MNLGRTLLIDAPAMTHLVRQIGLTGCTREIAERIRKEFMRWNSFEKSARLAFHSQDGVIELMPITDGRQFSMKYVNGHPRNTAQGLPTVMAFGVLSDVDTGAPLLLCELTLLTAIRTAAMSALAAKYLARQDSRTMALIGNGAQSEFQALAFRDLLSITHLRLFDTDSDATMKLVTNLEGAGLRIDVCRSAAEAVCGADIVTTITADKTNATIITPEMLENGVHINAVGGDCPGKTELHPAVLERSSVFVEFEPQSRLEGDVQQMTPDFAVTEIWRVFTGHQTGRQSRDQITVFDSVGFALEDYAAIAYVHETATRLGIGRPIELVACAQDPKDLYGTINPAPHMANSFRSASITPLKTSLART